MEPIQIVTSIITPVTISLFLWFERRSIMNLIADFRLEKEQQGREVTEAELLNKMDNIMGHQYGDRSQQ